ncbi:MAG: hypothetical protein LBN38_08095, partial [Verrucomicrobiota bacterium]|nr:hypothetical protein [Verrucomicrobiota bacterium]
PGPLSSPAVLLHQPIKRNGDVEVVYDVRKDVPMQARLQSTTNLASPVVWVDEAGEYIDSTGAFTNVIPAAPGTSVKFFRVIYTK